MRLLMLATLGGFAVFTGCSETTKPVDVGMTDTQVEDGIKSRYAADADLARADLKVDADVSDHKLTVSGSVTTEAARVRAVDMAKAFEPSLLLTDKIDVKPLEIPRAEYTEDLAREARERAKTAGNSVGDSLDDAWIHTKITTKLLTDKDTPGRHINVDVDKNVVTLRGNVETALAKDEAERIAKETEGVKRVKNLLIVTP
ncbi:MAG: BON domain-containing protein [Bryobacteraceae bacterium]